jgi:hypothetical protein
MEVVSMQGISIISIILFIIRLQLPTHLPTWDIHAHAGSLWLGVHGYNVDLVGADDDEDG